MTPSVFIVNPEGKILFSHQGPLDLDLFFKNLPEEIAGKQEEENIKENTTIGAQNEQ